MSDAKVRGFVHVIEETKTFGQKGFRKRLIVLEQDNGRFANYIPVEFVQDACDQANNLKIGDEIEVNYRLSGRKWQKGQAIPMTRSLKLRTKTTTIHRSKAQIF
jgi:Domain of unknown function (DUF3127)